MGQTDALVQSPPRNWVRRAVGPVARPIRRWAWECSNVLRLGKPSLVVAYGDGFGDHLLCTALFREMRVRGHTGLWMMSGHPSLFEGNTDVDAVVPTDWRYPELAQRWGGRSIMPNYAEIIESEDRSVAPERHIISCMCQRAGLTGPVTLRPYMTLSPAEKDAGRLAARQIAIQSSILSASMPIRNKQWKPDRFQEVVENLRHAYTFVQVGSPRDPQLEGVVDLRGKTSLRQTGAVMSQSLVFIGLVGFLMHLARAVDCRSVIVYGGREAPWQSGYSSNENIFTPLDCSPCWLWSKCDHGHKCMDDINASHVIDAVHRQVELAGEPLAVDIDDLDAPCIHS